MSFWLLAALASSDAGVRIETFKSPREAFASVFAAAPLILGVGEYHELKGAPKVPSAIARFTRDGLPVLDGGASSLIVETWMLNGRCGQVEQQASKAVAKATQRPEETEDEVTTMMGRAYDLGLTNHTLLIDCDDYRSMLDGEGELDAERSLVLMREKVEALAVAVREKGEGGWPGKMLILYGGALHNDRHPAAADVAYAFGPSLQRETDGGYVELDLLVPEWVERDEELLRLSWFKPALAEARRGRTVLVAPAPDVRVLVFPFTKKRR